MLFLCYLVTFYKFFISSIIHIKIIFFLNGLFFFSSWAVSKQYLLSSKLYFLWHTFMLFYLHYHHLLCHYIFLFKYSILSWFFHLTNLPLIQLLFSFVFFFISQWPIWFIVWSIKFCFNVFCNITNVLAFFVSTNHIKTHKLLFSLFLISK